MQHFYHLFVNPYYLRDWRLEYVDQRSHCFLNFMNILIIAEKIIVYFLKSILLDTMNRQFAKSRLEDFQMYYQLLLK